jgi:hypothetical protein
VGTGVPAVGPFRNILPDGALIRPVSQAGFEAASDLVGFAGPHPGESSGNKVRFFQACAAPTFIASRNAVMVFSMAVSPFSNGYFWKKPTMGV